jgi:hypothetical protein
MGLLGSTVKYGGLFLVAREGMKTYERHNEKKRNEQQYLPPQGSRSVEQTPYASQPPPQQFEQPRSVQGSFHQVWCKGNCGGHCIPPETWRSLGLEQPAPQYETKAPVY